MALLPAVATAMSSHTPMPMPMPIACSTLAPKDKDLINPCIYSNSRYGSSVPALRLSGGSWPSALASLLSKPHERRCEIGNEDRAIWLLRHPQRRIKLCGGVGRIRTSNLNQQGNVSVLVSIEESVSAHPHLHLQAVAKELEIDGLLVVKLAVVENESLDGEKEVKLSVLICDDNYIKKLNKHWLGQDKSTDLLSFPQHQASEISPILLLGDIVISAETAARQAEERGHTFLDEIRILLVRGILHLLGYDHEGSLEASKKMEEQEQRILCRMGWKEKGLISDSLVANNTFNIKDEAGTLSDNKDWKAKNGVNRVNRKRTSPFKLLFCDLDGTLLNSSSKITQRTTKAVRAAIQHGVQVIIATGKTRPAAIMALRAAGLEGDGGAISLRSPGIFLQGLLVYRNGGSLLHRETLNLDVCSEGFSFSMKHNIPLVGFCGDNCVTPFEHPLVDALHTVYYEPKAQVIGLVEDFRKELIQKLLFYSTHDTVASFLKPHWLSVTQGRARVVQALPEMLEILPVGASKGVGIQMLLDELRISSDEVMAIGDGENDIEMLKLVGLGVVMGNGAAQTIAIADAKVGSNDEDGVAEAIEEYILP